MTKMLQPFWKGGAMPSLDPPAMQQVAALCLRDGKDGREVLLIKSSRGRWILPKGWPMDDKTDAEAAKLEAWEEAGVHKGKVGKAPVGGFVAEKRYENGAVVPCFVSVYRIDVAKMRDDYPEADFRVRKWMPLKQAIKKVDDVGLQALLKTV